VKGDPEKMRLDKEKLEMERRKGDLGVALA